MKPYQFFLRALDEIYGNSEKRIIKTPGEISQGDFSNLNYQLDAIRQGLDCLDKYDGVLVADVVGLGKSIIAVSIAYNIAFPRTIIITPPHLKPQWEKYIQRFHLVNAGVISSGKIEKLYTAMDLAGPTLYIIDEAHRYRNENTTAYRMLHQLIRACEENKTILLTATPYNNHPKDIYALLKLFQIPSRATLNTIDNLGLRFSQLIAQYNQLAKTSKQNLTPQSTEDMSALAEKMRTMIEPLVIRRSRLDLAEITNYAEDLEQQKITFAKVKDPQLISYDLDSLAGQYYYTLKSLDEGELIGAKYKPLTYLADEAEFGARYKNIFNFNLTQQLNMAKLAKRLFVLRFESSQYAFRKTLENMISSHRAAIELWEKENLVAISKSRTLDKLEGIKDDKFTIPRTLLSSDYINDVIEDLTWLEKIYSKWFETNDIFDPKQTQVENLINKLLQENSARKIVIFTSFADTAKYITDELQKHGNTRTILYTSTRNQNLKDAVTQNFDASLAEIERKDDYDIIVATDALSEGFNLHRAGVVINYDIPYNPTRVIQRVGRINRIDQRVFSELTIYNLFPTTIGEKVVNLKGISGLKVLLMNQIIGNDTKILTSEEEIESFFQKQYLIAGSDNDAAWDNTYRNVYNTIKTDSELINIVRKIKTETSLSRKGKSPNIASLALAQRGNNLIFMSLDHDHNIQIISPKDALKYLQADEKEKEIECSAPKNLEKFKKELSRPYELPKMLGNRGRALDVIEALCEVCPQNHDYLEKIHNALRKYDDLCDAELQIITNLKLDDLTKAVKELKAKIPEWYLDAISAKAMKVESIQPQIIFVEDFK